MTKVGDLRILKLLSETSNIIADGEILQLVNSSNIELSKEKYCGVSAMLGKSARIEFQILLN
jgi:octaprenyl-diphosphate synthase